ncbi:MAG: hypothetical protein WC845_00315 [Candidatus Staskawiczbacteria bacterium]|jgi:hypothetical protein
MAKKNVIIICVLLLAIGILSGALGYYYFSPVFNNQYPQEPVNNVEDDKYPDVVRGIVDMSGTKVTIRTEEGKVYWVWPVMSKEYYLSVGWKDGQTVEVKGKILYKNNAVTEDRIIIKPLNP